VDPVADAGIFEKIVSFTLSLELIGIVAMGLYFRWLHQRLEFRYKQDELRIACQEEKAGERELESILAIKCLLRIADLSAVTAKLLKEENVNGDLDSAVAKVAGMKEAYRQLLRLKGLEGMEEFEDN